MVKNRPKSCTKIWATFVRNFVVKILQKQPNLDTLISKKQPNLVTLIATRAHFFDSLDLFHIHFCAKLFKLIFLLLFDFENLFFIPNVFTSSLSQTRKTHTHTLSLSSICAWNWTLLHCKKSPWSSALKCLWPIFMSKDVIDCAYTRYISNRVRLLSWKSWSHIEYLT